MAEVSNVLLKRRLFSDLSKIKTFVIVAANSSVGLAVAQGIKCVSSNANGTISIVNCSTGVPIQSTQNIAQDATPTININSPVGYLWIGSYVVCVAALFYAVEKISHDQWNLDYRENSVKDHLKTHLRRLTFELGVIVLLIDFIVFPVFGDVLLFPGILILLLFVALGALLNGHNLFKEYKVRAQQLKSDYDAGNITKQQLNGKFTKLETSYVNKVYDPNRFFRIKYYYNKNNISSRPPQGAEQE